MMEIKTKIRASTMDVVPFNRIEIGSVFKYEDDILFKFDGAISFRLRDGAHFAFNQNDEVRVTTIKVAEI